MAPRARRSGRGHKRRENVSRETALDGLSLATRRETSNGNAEARAFSTIRVASDAVSRETGGYSSGLMTMPLSSLG